MYEVQVMVCLERCGNSRPAGLRVVGPLIPHHQLASSCKRVYVYVLNPSVSFVLCMVGFNNMADKYSRRLGVQYIIFNWIKLMAALFRMHMLIIIKKNLFWRFRLQ